MLVVLLGLGTKATRLGEEEDHVSDENTCFSCHKHDLRCSDFLSKIYFFVTTIKAGTCHVVLLCLLMLKHCGSSS